MTQSDRNIGQTKSPLDAAQKIVVELQGMTSEQQSLALKFATETLGLQLPTSPAHVTHPPIHSPIAAQPTLAIMPGQRIDIKTFTALKEPKSDQQFAAVVAYYYQFEAAQSDRKDSVDASTMKDAARQAGRKQVSNWGITLDNARRAGYLDKAERGAYRLNAVGENLVAITLPGNAGSGQGNNNRSKKRGTKSKTTKKKTAKSR